MVRKTGQIIRRGSSTWLVRIYVGRDPETRKRRYIGKFIHGGLRSAQAHLNRMLAERDLGRNIRSSRQTVGQYLDHWLNICARPRLRVKSFCDYTNLLARYVRPRLGTRPLGELSPAEIQTVYSESAEPKAVGTHDSLHARSPLFGIAAGRTLEAPPDESGRGRTSAEAITAVLHRIRCRTG